MQTGEGKTLACAPAAYLHSLAGRGVHVATTNAYLAKRDRQIVRPAFELLGIPIGLLPEGAGSDKEKHQAYRCDVTYGPGYEFGFDYLRNQLSLRRDADSQLGKSTLALLDGKLRNRKAGCQRGLYYSIVDEADNVMLDDAASPLILTGPTGGEAADADVHRAARRLVDRLVPGEHFRPSACGNPFELTAAGNTFIHQQEDSFPIEKLQRTWAEYVVKALHAASLIRDVHYIVTPEDMVQIVDGSSGRIFADRTWGNGLHQAVEAKEGVGITPENQPIAQITRQRFLRLYQRLGGMTGTATGCEREFLRVFELDVIPIPLRIASRRQHWPTRVFAGSDEKWQAISKSVCELHRRQRPVLVGTSSIADSERLADLLREMGLDFELLNGLQHEDEAEIVARAGRRSAITIATSLAGRGTDIGLGPGVAESGGLHVIVCEWSDSSRVDRQLIGRCARQGDPGSSQVFVSADDLLIRRHGAWLAAPIRRYANSSGEAVINLDGPLRRIQRSAERAGYAARCDLLRQDLARDSLFSRRSLQS